MAAPDGDGDKRLAELDRLRRRVRELEAIEAKARESEKALRANETRLRAMFENTGNGVAVYEAVDEGEDFVFLDINRASERIEGLGRDQLVGKRITEAFPGVRKFGLLEVMARVWRTGNPEHFPIGQYKDERIAGWRDNYVFRLPSGEVIAVYADVTEQKQTEQALRDSQKMLDQAQRIAHVGSFHSNLRTGRSVWSDELNRIYGRPSGLPPPSDDELRQYRHEEDRDRVARAIGDAERDCKPFDLEYRIRREDDSVRTLHLIGTWFRDDEGAVSVFSGTVQDITERRRLEEERSALEMRVLQAQKLESLGVLAGGIAHDFNNLLVPILGNADLAFHDMEPGHAARQCVGEIRDAAQRAAELCKQMLAYSGKGQFVVRAVDVNVIVQEMAHLLEVAVSKKATVRLNLGADLPAVEADVTQVRQVIMNLITNASDAIGDEEGAISISTGVMSMDHGRREDVLLEDAASVERYVTLEVSDTGPGMDAETKRRMFDPFFTTKFTGRGLGLAAVLGIVRGHGGGIKVESEPGRGTTMTVLLPVVDRPADAVHGPTDDVPDWQGSGTVLLVDDDPAVCAMAKRMLERIGFSVLTAGDGRAALDIFSLQRDAIRCVVLDLTMPHMDGAETFKGMREITADVPVIISSGYDEREVQGTFGGSGIAGFVQKPYQFASLRETIRMALGG